MNKNTLWTQPNVAYKAAASDTLHGDYEPLIEEKHLITWPLNFAHGIAAVMLILDFRIGYTTAVGGDAQTLEYGA